MHQHYLSLRIETTWNVLLCNFMISHISLEIHIFQYCASFAKLTTRPPCESPAILSCTPELVWTLLSCGRILNQYGSLLIKYINMSIIYLFYKVFIISEIKVALMNYSLSKAASKAAKHNGIIALISLHSASCWQYHGMIGVWANRWWLP